LQCGMVLVQREKVKRRKFCDSLCRSLWWSENPAADQRKATYQQPCAGCGQLFTAYGNRQRKYCTHGCYVAARFGKTSGAA